MRYLTALVATLVLAACSTAPVTRNQPRDVSSPQGIASELQKASLDSVVQFLLTSAAADFHMHRPPDPVGFRDVRIGHIVTANGASMYMLCGQFLPREGDKAQWMPFATIKTSGYEQHLGSQATAFSQNSSVVWDKVDDLSSTLLSRLDALR